MFLNSSLLETIQEKLPFGKLPQFSLPSQIPEKKNIKKPKKAKQKSRAYSNNDEISMNRQSKPIANRERSQTENFVIQPMHYIPPPITKEKPWGEASLTNEDFCRLQSEESKAPLKVNKWNKCAKASAKVEFLELQSEEKEFNEIDDALLLIALMESIQK